MQLGLVGLGRMGAGMRDRLQAQGHEVIAYDLDVSLGDVSSLSELIGGLHEPRAVWVMVPAGEATEQTVQQLVDLLGPRDVLIEGGNSHYRDSQRRAAAAAERGVQYLDVGVSGGIWGLREGFCLMAGGTPEAVERVRPVMEALATEEGWAHVGPSGSGHFVKMVHNGIEYGLMQAYAEGFGLLEAYDDDLDLRSIADLWNHGSVVRSWLLELAVLALARDPGLTSIPGYVQDTGEGRWAVQEGVDRRVPVGVIAQSLFTRFASREEDAFSLRLLAALRQEFGGHSVRGA